MQCLGKCATSVHQGRLAGSSAPSLPPLAVLSSAAAMARDAAPAPSNALPLGNALTEYDDLLAGAVAAVVQRAGAIGAEVQRTTQYLESAFKAERNVIAAMLECKVRAAVFLGYIRSSGLPAVGRLSICT